MRHRLIGPIVGALALVACGGGGEEAEPTITTEPTTTTVEATTTVPVEPLRILVTNDDGFGAEGIDALVEGLRGLDGTEVVVVAPPENRSGSGSTTTPPPVTAVEGRTASGYDATAVGGADPASGFPADQVAWALDKYGEDHFHLVLSGINEGQNIGPLVDISGTVGGARAGVAAGIPAVAVSQGVPEPDYRVSVEVVLDWIERNRSALLDRTAPATVVNINAPTCAAGTEVRGVVEVPTATDAGDRAMYGVPQDCASTLTDPADDIDAFLHGYVAVSEVPPAA